MNRSKDRAFLSMAYALARKASGLVSPNPLVGSVIVKRDEVVGYGWHEGPGHRHAEIVALDRAGSSAHGAEIYITLEPCTHWGRTPPCVDRLISVRPRRVILSDIDPNPRVNGRGIARLREAGISVSTGELASVNRSINRAYIKFITSRRPLVILKAALSLDGKLATRTGHSRWISSDAARDYIHLIRGECDALIVGIGTVLLDDPRLTVRHPLWPERRIHRICIDGRLRLPVESRLATSPGGGPVLVFTLETAPRKREEALARKGVEVIRLPGPQIRLEEVFEELGRRGMSQVMVEGGPRIHTALLDSRLADRALLSLSPKLIGGEKAPSLHLGEGAARVDNALRLRYWRSFRIGDDILIEGAF